MNASMLTSPCLRASVFLLMRNWQKMLRAPTVCACLIAVLTVVGSARAEEAVVRFESGEGRVDVLIGKQRVAQYVYRDKEILRPYFHAVTTLSGRQVTRNHPPKEGVDPADHATMHPGVWVACGDLGGEDFWRNKGRVAERRFVEEPTSDGPRGSFVVENEYVAAKDERTICRERCRWTIAADKQGWWLVYDGEFTATVDGLAFGDQEEMGLGVRLATALTVRKGGEIVDSAGRKNEKGVWGKPAAWCDYAGTIDGRRVGVAVVPHRENFRESWFHVRDYGLMVANPFGRNAFTRGEKSRVELGRDKPLRLRFAAFVHEAAAGEAVDIEAAVKRMNGD